MADFESPTSDGHFVTQLLDKVRVGEAGARDELVDAVYQTLRHIAEHQKRYVGSQTLDAEALVGEAYFKVLGQENVDFENRRHLYGAFSRAMREILIDAARRRNALKRGGSAGRVTIDEVRDADTDQENEHGLGVLEVHETLAKLEAGSIPSSKIHVDDGYVGEGYGIPAESTLEAISLAAEYEGILLDPVYSAKGMAGLIGLARQGFFKPSDNVLFLHTGGSAALFAYEQALLDYKQ